MVSSVLDLQIEVWMKTLYLSNQVNKVPKRDQLRNSTLIEHGLYHENLNCFATKSKQTYHNL